jgi:hypothetical protein
VQGLINQENGRYSYYARQFEAILKALPGTALAPDPGTPADPNTPTDPAEPPAPVDPANPGGS